MIALQDQIEATSRAQEDPIAQERHTYSMKLLLGCTEQVFPMNSYVLVEYPNPKLRGEALEKLRTPLKGLIWVSDHDDDAYEVEARFVPPITPKPAQL
jgi:hypothetical protein